MTAAPERVVILGATGYVGRALSTCLGRRPGLEVIGHSTKTLDLTRPEALAALRGIEGAGTVLVLGAALTPDRGQNLDIFGANVAMAANLARYLEGHEVGRCVYVSSDAVYGFEENPVTEASPVAPSTYYALAKYAGERVLAFAAGARGIPLLTLRVTGIYGPGDPHGSYGPNAFARSLAKERTIRLFGNGEEQRDHIHVDDVARLMALLILSGTSGLFNLATGESHSFAEIVEAIRRLVPYKFTVTSVPRKGAITHRRFDTTALREAAPGHCLTPFHEGLRATLDAFGALSTCGK